MADPTFNGSYIFGPVPEFNHDDPPNAAQVNHYPGTFGVERLDLGDAESYIQVRGVMTGVSTADLAANLENVRNLKKNAVLGNLVDTDGLTWTNCIIEWFKTSGRTCQTANSQWSKDYEMRLIILGISPTGDGEPTTP